LLLHGELSPERSAALWQSADGRDLLRYDPYVLQTKDSEGKSQPANKRKLIRQRGNEIVFTSEAVGNLPGTLDPAPNGKYLFQPDDGQPRNIPLSKRFTRMHDGLTGKLLWEKTGWLVYAGNFQPSIAWSADGESLSLVRNYPNADYHGWWPELYHRCLITLVRAADGAVLAEGAPTEWIEKVVTS